MTTPANKPPVALVTGSASGIGRSITEALRDAGYIVYAGMRGVEGRNADAARSLQAEGDERVHPIEMDVLSEDSCAAAVEAIHAANLHLDVVVNNAGMLMNGMAETFTPDQFLTILDTNAVSWLRVNRAVLPVMRAQGQGTIVYVGSTTTYIPEPFIGVYEASKAAGDALARAMALEIRPFGIDSLFLVPGAFPVGTDHFADAHTGDDRGREMPYSALSDRLPALTDHIKAIDREEGLRLTVRTVGERLSEALQLPARERVDHVFIDGQAKGADVIAETIGEAQARFVERLGFGDLLAPMQRRMLNVPERPS
ncbi:SDR family NAD(P)-dependent oxidoreductase [Stakelama pacifica]|uniref:NADP-dependent 3-hydroxy acid dehydrogenase YdfG n=1 Tax=Stakelama pacifica TaxID=517720 RepID=A0A4R6FN42_9SPHN|nr:SDR family NAD(P)-dependent oxidoreductase [Stakelama pacifica]TDN82837.1 NADP-dependent 3-hydroxy acid dehydrogenase YdfG [Stakelama pacifica]GGO95448.1 short-chain dehydrogenase/reductase SDR [Stakelama pacifica]